MVDRRRWLGLKFFKIILLYNMEPRLNASLQQFDLNSCTISRSCQHLSTCYSALTLRQQKQHRLHPDIYHSWTVRIFLYNIAKKHIITEFKFVFVLKCNRTMRCRPIRLRCIFLYLVKVIKILISSSSEYCNQIFIFRSPTYDRRFKLPNTQQCYCHDNNTADYSVA